MTGRIVLAVAPGTAERAVDTAFALAAERGSALLAIRTWHDPDLPLGGWLQPDRTARWDAAHAKARCELDSALERARAAQPSVHVTPIVVDDDLVPFLSALSTRADLLVVGRSTQPEHRASPVDTLVRQAACPVLVVPSARRSPIARSDTSASTSDGSFASRRRPVRTTTLEAWPKEDR
jgi:nucleotide-binding universal stress UspA family protein